ncbi:purine nucleoside phosphorylase [Clostridium tetanomorphum]|nr:purine nucleoside phosphorylase [Clostridium tetanomorphum]
MNIIKIKESVNYVKSKVDMIPEIGIILGSGLGDLADKVEERININMKIYLICLSQQ